MIKNVCLGVAVILMIAGCVEEDIRRLQTDQSFEGEEAYLISSVLDEHLFLLWQPLSFYADSSNTADIPGCPEIRLDSINNQVTVSFDDTDCSDQSGSRSGKIVLNYTPLPLTQGYQLFISYVDYTYESVMISGVRSLNISAQSRDKRVFSDSSSNLLILSGNESSSRVSFTLSHEISIFGGQITQGISTGYGDGRNWVGRQVRWEITGAKLYTFDCPEKSRARPNSGEETWTISRSATSDVVHRLSFHKEPECVTHTIIRLDEGVEMKKTP